MLSLPLVGQYLVVDLEGRVEVFQGLDPDLQQEVLELYFGEDGIGVLPPKPAHPPWTHLEGARERERKWQKKTVSVVFLGDITDIRMQ